MNDKYSIKFAYQTILWGPRPRDYSTIFQRISEYGFKGVEMAQAIEFLPAPGDLLPLLKHYNLTLVSLCAGSLQERYEYCAKAGVTPEYYYVCKVSENDMTFAKEKCITLALHPHAYTETIQQDVIDTELSKHPELQLIVDTAHLYVSHIDCIDIFQKHYDRIAAVHIKDWTEKYGRSFYKYARGFSMPGDGEVHPEQALDYLTDRGFPHWAVIECDYATISGDLFLERCHKWLHSHHYISNKVTHTSTENKDICGRPSWVIIEDAHQNHPETYDALQEKLGAFGIDVITFLRTGSFGDFGKRVISSLMQHHTNLDAVQLWEYSPTNSLLSLLAESENLTTSVDDMIIRSSNPTILGVAERMNATHISINQLVSFTEKKSLFHLSSTQCRTQIVTILPVANSFNIAQAQLIIVLSWKENPYSNNNATLMRYSEIIGFAYEKSLDDLCQTLALQIEQSTPHSGTFEKYLEELRECIQRMTNSGGATIFLEDSAGKRLEVASTSGIQWRDGINLEEQFYKEGDGSRTSCVWKTNEAILIYERDKSHIPKSQETNSNPELSLCLIVPIRNQQGRAIGVLRLRNKTKGAQLFTLSDMAVAESLCQSTVPNLLTMQQGDRFRRTIDRTVHEIKTPLTVVRNASLQIQQDFNSKRYDRIKKNIQEVLDWIRLQQQQIKRLDHVRYRISDREAKLKPNISQVLLYEDIVSPAIYHLRGLLTDKGFNRDSIDCDSLFHIPKIWVDRSMFQQVFFNLIGNSVKYSFSDNLQIRIWSARDGGRLLIYIDDYGKGIPTGYEEIVFHPYVRAPEAEQCDATGDGLGLWIVRDLVELHKGSISVLNNKFPTRIAISLPFSITDANWVQQ